jgi:uncharacterized membrane protein YphA (DoxX/SURF4 family)
MGNYNTKETKGRRTMNITLWIVQILLALAFAMAGVTKTTQPIEKLATNMGWVNDVTAQIVRLIGTLELLGAAGLILPAVTGIWPWLTPVAGIGLVLTMVGAMITHVRRREFSGLGVNVILLALALFVAYGRFVIAPL